MLDTRRFLVQTIKKDNPYLAELLPRLQKFYLKYILQKTAGHVATHQKAAFIVSVVEEKEGPMIACDNPE